MPVPKFDAFATPILTILVEEGSDLPVSEIRERAAERLRLKPEERKETLDNGRVIYHDRSAWALTWMKYPGWVERAGRGRWAATSLGRQRLENPEPITAAEMRLHQKRQKAEAETPDDEVVEEQNLNTATPMERIDTAVAELRGAVIDEITERLAANSAEFFERAVLDVLGAMGYVGDLGRIEHSGRTGDWGIDGVLYLDHLGLERVHVQAKRWQGSVGQSTVRDFAGAMDVQGATKGVIVTTSTFTKAAREYVRLSPKVIRLIDGAELARFMVDFGVGVSHERSIKIPKIDLDYYES